MIPLDTIEPGAVPAYVTIEAAGSCGGGAQLAAVLGVRAATVSRWANGHTRPNVRHMRTLCALAGVEIAEARRRWLRLAASRGPAAPQSPPLPPAQPAQQWPRRASL